MRARFNQSFKSQAVEKALSRAEGISLAEMAKSPVTWPARPT